MVHNIVTNQKRHRRKHYIQGKSCLLYTSDAADEEDSVDLGGRRIIKKKKHKELRGRQINKKTKK